MRVVFILVTVVFVLLCIFFTRWYLCTVRHLCETVANGEILAMILTALLIGFAGSWLMSEQSFRFLRTQLGILQKEKSGLNEQLLLLEKENQSTRRHVEEWQQEVTLLAQVKKVTEPLLMQARNQVSILEAELKQFQKMYEDLKRETEMIRNTAERLKNELLVEKPKPVVSEERPAPREKGPIRITPVPGPKDDLTLISGIGPAIQKKLYNIGITTFKQLSEATPEIVEEIVKAIRFFPDRIGRENWIGQAAAFAKKKS